MANAYKYAGPKKTQNCIGPDPSGPGASLVSGDRVGKVLERVGQEVAKQCNMEGYGPFIAGILEREVGPLLRAGQAMRDSVVIECEELARGRKR